MGSSGSGRRSSFSPVMGGDQESTVFICVLEVAIPCSTVPPLDCYSVSRDAFLSSLFQETCHLRRCLTLVYPLVGSHFRSRFRSLDASPTPFASTSRLPRPPPRKATTTSLPLLASYHPQKYQRRNSHSKEPFRALRRSKFDGQRGQRRASSTRRPRRP